MNLLALILALIVEQFRPLDYNRWVATPTRSVASWCESKINAGEYRHGVLGWFIMAGGAVVLSGIVYFALDLASPVASFLWSFLLLYLTMGFRQFSHHFTEIHIALKMGDVERARVLLASWRSSPAEMWSSEDIARLSIEQALLASHRHVFAVLFWFVILPGPCGAVLYRVSMLLADAWRGQSSAREPFGIFAQKAFAVIDWLPQRMTATGFAVVGDFEDAVHCWRTQAAAWGDQGAGIILAAGAGALGVKLGMPVVDQGAVSDRNGLGIGADADVDFMQSAVGLVWRALVLWLLLLFMLSLASLAG